MKTIDVFGLEKLEYDYWVTVKLTTSLDEALEWRKYSYQSFSKYTLTLPQEIQVQRDY